MSHTKVHGIHFDQLSDWTAGTQVHAGARLISLQDGRERGVRVVEMRSGSGLEIEVIVDGNGDLGRLTYQGKTLSWHTPQGLCSPWQMNPESSNGQGFLQGVGGLLNTCGLDHIRQPDTETRFNVDSDKHYNAVYPLHGGGAFQPAILRGYGVVEDVDVPYVYCETEFTQTIPLVTTLKLQRRIEMEIGRNKITLSDKVINVGRHASSHMMLYHFNLGLPLIAPGSHIDIPNRQLIWQSFEHNPLAAYSPPEPNSLDKLSIFKNMGHKAKAAVISPELGLFLSIDYDSVELPYCQVLRMDAPGHYGVGIEPCTTGYRNRKEAFDKGEMAILERGESRTYSISLTLEHI
ncbi:DUF4432 family protein [Vibrio nigripulchritudo]|uniref:DUF4432 family protein n=1 Tax=Vibrio nigripulchritudo TaxID=28173 RepID=UPI0024901859|nr:DUF4432 family protein [Vibrio nigripulchritudo]BDU40062.1 DUF4432 domain-containing protein [Vibrio nigripulchritudo]BDU45786.1 DUF4432 domain-containing protein [Vibrio nigripulchritudo]